jgi:hypothetical protein
MLICGRSGFHGDMLRRRHNKRVGSRLWKSLTHLHPHSGVRGPRWLISPPLFLSLPMPRLTQTVDSQEGKLFPRVSCGAACFGFSLASFSLVKNNKRQSPVSRLSAALRGQAPEKSAKQLPPSPRKQ